MNVSALNQPLPWSGAGLPSVAAPRGTSFRRVLEDAVRPTNVRTEPSPREAAEQFVGSAFIMPILQSLRESPFLDGGPLAPGPAEKRFGPLLDQAVADGITKRANFPLIDLVLDRLTARGSAGPGTSETLEVSQ